MPVGDRFGMLEAAYKQRVEDLEDAMRRLKGELAQDEIIGAMQGDPASEGFISLRMKEIVDEGMAGEKEAQIHRLLQDKAGLQNTLGQS